MTNSNQIISINPIHVISQEKNHLITTSLLIAETFGKLHKNIIQKIEKIECSTEFVSANFSAHTVDIDLGANRTRKSKIYNMTKDGFMFLVMGFTGKKAARIKEAYINAFNVMEAKLASNFQSNVKTLTFNQQHHIKSQVGKLGLINDKGISSIYQSIREKFNVTSYSHIPAIQYGELCEFLKCEPLIGELVDNMPVPQQIRTVFPRMDFPKKDTCLNYLLFEEMFDCGWSLKINKLLVFMKKNQANKISYQVGDLSGVEQEISSLLHIIEQQEQKLYNIKNIVS